MHRPPAGPGVKRDIQSRWEFRLRDAEAARISGGGLRRSGGGWGWGGWSVDTTPITVARSFQPFRSFHDTLLSTTCR